MEYLTRLLSPIEPGSYQMIVLALAIAFSLTVIWTTVWQRVVGRYVRALIKAGATSPETALAVADTDGGSSRILRRALKPRSTLRRIISAARVGGEDGAGKASIDDYRFYIPEDKLGKAASLYGGDMTRSKRSQGVLLAVIEIVLIFAVAAAAIIFIPELLTMLENFTSHYFG